MKFEIPKEIKSKPKLVGLEVKEAIIFVVGSFLIFTMLKELVHSIFVLPYFIVSLALLFYMILPSSNNPSMKNYKSITLFFKRNKNNYHPLDINNENNKAIHAKKEKEGLLDGV